MHDPERQRRGRGGLVPPLPRFVGRWNVPRCKEGAVSSLVRRDGFTCRLAGTRRPLELPVEVSGIGGHVEMTVAGEAGEDRLCFPGSRVPG